MYSWGVFYEPEKYLILEEMKHLEFSRTEQHMNGPNSQKPTVMRDV